MNNVSLISRMGEPQLESPFGLSLHETPQNIMAEQSVLGSIIANAKNMHDVPFLQPEHFADPMHGRIFAEQRRLIDAGGVGDAVSLQRWFALDPDSESVEGNKYLVGLITAWVGPGTTVPYAREIKACWHRRRQIEKVREVIDLLHGPFDAQELATALQRVQSEIEDQDESPSRGPTRIDGDSWLIRDLPRPEPILGEVICTSTRALIGGPTGSGKTNLAMGMAGSIATGRGFVHWFGPSEPRTVLYVDGEMARDLIQDRIRDLHRRLGKPSLANFHMLCREDFPVMLGLNTPAGQKFILDKIDEINPSVIFFDSRMCLLSGDMRDEEAWTNTMPLVLELTRRQIAQIWLDHTGHDATHIYGTKTKEWQMDLVILIEDANEKGEADVKIKINFIKARRRRPNTREDFTPGTITLRDDEWTWEPQGTCKKTATGQPIGKVRPGRVPFYDILLTVINEHPGDGPGRTQLKIWQDECRRLGRDDGDFRRAKSELLDAHWIAIDGEFVTDMKNRWG
jgi:hypothetical protein